jgi:hypothetical protein
MSKKPLLLITSASILYTMYVAGSKLALEQFAGNLNGLHLAPWIAIIATMINLFFYFATGCFKLETMKKFWKTFSLSGFATGNIIISGIMTIAMKAVRITEASTLNKATAVPASFFAMILFDKKERKQLLQDKFQLCGTALAFVAIAANLYGIGTRISALPVLVFLLASIYATASFTRTPLMRKTPVDPLQYGAGDQLFACLVVVVFFGFVRWGNLSVLPHLLQDPFAKMQYGLAHPTPKLLGWAFFTGLPFALYAPLSILLLKYNEGKSTAVLGNIMQKLVGVIGAVFGLPVMHLCAGVFYSASSKLPWYEKSEVIGLLAFAAATLVSLFPKIRAFLKSKSPRSNASSRGQNTTRSGGLQPSPA